MNDRAAEALLAEGTARFQAGRHGEAEAAARRVLEMMSAHQGAAPDATREAAARRLLAACRAAAGDVDTAAEELAASLAAEPGHDATRLQLALLLARRNRYEEVVALLDGEVRRRPGFLAGYRPLAEALWATGAREAAIALYRILAARLPQDGTVHAALGTALRQTKALDEALPVLRRAVALLEPVAGGDPGAFRQLLTSRIALAEVLANLSTEGASHYAEAAAVAHAARAMGVADPDMVTWLGFVLHQAGEYAAAEACFQATLEHRPDHFDARRNLSMLRLLRGAFAEGWRDYEVRRWSPEARGGAPPEAPWIAAADLRGQRVRVVMEQGFGDQLHFARYFPLLAGRGAEVEVALDPGSPLRPLLAEMPAIAGFADRADAPGAADVVVPVMSLPLAFGTDATSIPAEVPYLRVPQARRAAWRGRLGDGDGRPRVGVVWWGNPAFGGDRQRSIPLSRFATLLRRDDVAFHVLAHQLRPDEAEAAALAAVHEGIADFADTAALVETMDLVIAVDTAVAHLAGALAKPVWILLPATPDWRWMLAREDSPWYPTARLFRQTTRDDWHGVLLRVREALDATFG